MLAVVKRSGVTEPFSREKVSAGCVAPARAPGRRRRVESARATGRGHCAGRGSPEVASHEVGLAILGPLRELDEVAYLAFASVYRSFSSAEDFEREIEALRAHRSVGTSG